MDPTDEQWVVLVPLPLTSPKRANMTRQTVAGHARGAERSVVGAQDRCTLA